MATTIASGISFDTINTSVANVVRGREDALKATITGLGDNPTTADMLTMQQQIQQWTISTQIQSTVVQQVAEAIKGVIQKSS